MKKIPTLFRRDPADMRRLLPEVHPECQWVLDGEGVPTRKYDGTCVALNGDGRWWARREVKLGKHFPDGFQLVDADEVTGKRVGWEPIGNSGFYRWFMEAFGNSFTGGAVPNGDYAPGTYELIGPKINGNPEGAEGHWLIRHADAQHLPEPAGGRTFADLKQFLEVWHEANGIEGIVWHHPDGRMAKLKARDFLFDSPAMDELMTS